MFEKKTFTIAEIAKSLQLEFRGNGDEKIHGIASLQNAISGYATFLDNAKYRKFLADTHASLVVLHPKYLAECKTNVLLSNQPYLSYAKLAKLFDDNHHEPAEIHPTAQIGKNCRIGKNVTIGAYAVIADEVTIQDHVVIAPHTYIGARSQVGMRTRIYAHVSIYHDVQIGQHCIIHSNAVIGADGFGFAQDKDKWEKVPQLGGVVIGDDVEIGAHTAIDRGAIENTIIEDGVKLDNHIQIGHNVQIGAHTIIAGCVGIAGSTKIGKHCMIGGGAGILGHIEIADGVMITAMTGIAKSINEPGIYAAGMQPQKHEVWRKNAIYFHKLDEMMTRIKELEKKINTEEEV